MNKKEMLSIALFLFGLGFIIIGSLDILSIVANGLNLIFNLNLPDIFLNNFIFRTSLVLIGSLLIVACLFFLEKSIVTA